MKIGKVLGVRFTCELDSIIQVDQLFEKPLDKVIDIWNSFHSALPESVSIIMNIRKTKLLIERLNSHPLFMQPVLREFDYFFLLSQIAEGQKIITFKPMKSKESSPISRDPEMILRIFDDLSASHGINLVRGDILDKAISKTEAEIAMRGLISHYVESDLFKTYVVPFNENLSEFNHGKYIEEYFERFSRRDTETLHK